MKEEITSALLKIDKMAPEEADCILSMLTGGEYGVITAGDMAITDKGDYVTVLGYSENWLTASALEKLLKDKSSEEVSKALQKVNLSFEFINEKQVAIAIFYDKNQKERQDIMSISPSNLVAITAQNNEQTVLIAQNSTLMDKEVAKYLIRILKMDGSINLELKQSMILKALSCQIEILGQEYINFLKTEGILDDFMHELYKAVDQNGPKKNAEVVPLKWIEARI